MPVRRFLLATAALLTIALGVLSYRFGSGELVGLLGDALYAVMIYLVLACLWPTLRRSTVMVGALAFCVAIESLQATGLPGMLVERLPLLHLVFGTTFAWLDLLAYTVGVLTVALLDRAVSTVAGARRARRADALPAGRPDRTP